MAGWWTDQSDDIVKIYCNWLDVVMVMALIVGWQMDAQYKYGFTKVTTHGQWPLKSILHSWPTLPGNGVR